MKNFKITLLTVSVISAFAHAQTSTGVIPSLGNTGTPGNVSTTGNVGNGTAGTVGNPTLFYPGGVWNNTVPPVYTTTPAATNPGTVGSGSSVRTNCPAGDTTCTDDRTSR